MAMYHYYDFDIEADRGISDAIDSTPFDLGYFEECLADTDMMELDGCISSAVEARLPVEAIKLLVEAGASPDGHENAEETPIMTAIINGDTAVVTYLLSVGADTDLCNRDDCFSNAEEYPEIEEILETHWGEKSLGEEW